jgi:hypothetical protein
MKFLAKGKTERIIEDQDEKLTSLIKTFKDNLQNKYNRYAAVFFLCEALNLVLITAQFLMTGQFSPIPGIIDGLLSIILYLIFHDFHASGQIWQMPNLLTL